MKLIFAFLLMSFGFNTSNAAEGNDWKFGLGAGYSPSYMANLKGNGTSSGTPTSLTYDLNYANAAELGFSAWYIPQDAWAFLSGFQYGFERELKSGTVNGMSASTASSSRNFKLILFMLERLIDGLLSICLLGLILVSTNSLRLLVLEPAEKLLTVSVYSLVSVGLSENTSP